MLTTFQIDPVWYGIIFVAALAIGQAMPPVGVNLFTATNLIESDLDSVAKEALVFVLISTVILMIISLIPALSLYLPVKAGLYTP